jgi:hypothetical protein
MYNAITVELHIGINVVAKIARIATVLLNGAANVAKQIKINV